MLVESLIRMGEPLKNSSMTNKERMQLLSDCDSTNCKNYYQNVFLIEIDGINWSYHYMIVGSMDKKEFMVDKVRNIAYPIIYPQGGNALLAQGNYPAPCYLMYDPHIKDMGDSEIFANKVILPRLVKTIAYEGCDNEKLNQIAKLVAKVLASNYGDFIREEKQLGILYIVDHSLSEFCISQDSVNQRYFHITESKIKPGEHLYLDSEKCVKNIVEAKFLEAKTLGSRNNAVSTFTNKFEKEVVSVYNKYWLWLSSTWEAPRSIYWSKEDWTPGIKIDRDNYESYLYGVQFLNQITLPISSSILKEMFAPITSVEAKRNMKYSSFERIFGAPIILPLISEKQEHIYDKYKYLMEKDKDKGDADIHLSLIAGIDSALPKISDEFRLTLLYYSGERSRGDVHIRTIIEDVIPSVAKSLEKIINDIRKRVLPRLKKVFNIASEKIYYSLESLPSMIGNAYGPGYIWSNLKAVFDKKLIRLDRVHYSTVRRLNELANKEDYWAMRDELIFYYGYLYFYNKYNEELLGKGEEVNIMDVWEKTLGKYHLGEIKKVELESIEVLGYVTGLLLRQFSNSYHHSAGNDFVKHRVMKFGSKLTPEMIWKEGLLKCEELAMQRDLKLGSNFRPNLSQVLLSMLEANDKDLLIKCKDQFMTAFWSGYLMYKKQEQEEV